MSLLTISERHVSVLCRSLFPLHFEKVYFLTCSMNVVADRCWLVPQEIVQKGAAVQNLLDVLVQSELPILKDVLRRYVAVVVPADHLFREVEARGSVPDLSRTFPVNDSWIAFCFSVPKTYPDDVVLSLRHVQDVHGFQPVLLPSVAAIHAADVVGTGHGSRCRWKRTVGRFLF